MSKYKIEITGTVQTDLADEDLKALANKLYTDLMEIMLEIEYNTNCGYIDYSDFVLYILPAVAAE